jgi:metal-sulfur cluster biosynthetic enzyme
LRINVVDLGLIYGIAVEPDDKRWKVGIVMTMTTPACPYGPQLLEEVREVVGELQGVSDVDVRLTLNPPWTPDRMSDDARDELGLF